MREFFRLCFLAVLLIKTNLSAKSLELAGHETEYIQKERELIECLSSERGYSFFEKKWEKVKSREARKTLGFFQKQLESKDCDITAIQNKLEALKRGSLDLKERLNIENKLYSEKEVETSLENRRIRDEEFLTNESKGSKPCDLDKSFTVENLRDRSLWLENYLIYGHTCSTKMFKRAKRAQPINQKLQPLFDKLREEKPYTSDFKTDLLKGRNIAIVPSLAYEKVYMLFLPVAGDKFAKTFNKDPDHYLTVRMLANILKAYGAKNVTVIDRSTVMPMKEQAELTFKKLNEFGDKVGPYDVISQSAGSQVVNYILKNISKTKKNLPRGMKTWINVGGTPRGSAIAEYKSAYDFYLTEHLPGQIKTLNMINPFTITLLGGLSTVTRKVNVGDVKRLIRSAKEGMKIENIKDLSFKNPATQFSQDELKPGSATYELPIVNVTAVVENLEDRTPSQDPVIPLQSMYGVSEGSSLLVDSGIDSKKSAHLFLKGDHLSFYANTEKDKIASLYLQIYQTLLEGNFF